MITVFANLIGRFGNQLFTYAYSRALAEQNGYGFSSVPWIGEKIFDLNEPSADFNSDIGGHVQLIRDYCQRQECMIYTRAQVKEWFNLKPDIKRKLDQIPRYDVIGHRRVGDYPGYGYPVVSERSYYEASDKFETKRPVVISEEHGCKDHEFTGELEWLPDFYSMMRANVLFRGNSSFSWWAAMLGEGDVYSPVIEGLEGGKEHDCTFVKGNWPRLCNLPFVTDLHVK